MRRPVLAGILVSFFLTGWTQAATIKIATLAPDGSFWMKEVRRGADEIAERTGGRVQIRLYPGGTMGNDQAVLRKMRIGQLQGGMVVGMTLAGISPELQVYGLPLMFRSYEEVDHVRELRRETRTLETVFNELATATSPKTSEDELVEKEA